MHTSVICLSTIILFISMSPGSRAQGETALPFLLVHPSVEGNGMGGVSILLSSDDALAPVANPAHLGRLARDNTATLSLYTPSTEYLSSYRLPDMSYSVFAVNGGIGLHDYFSLPFPLTLGLGYSRVNLDLGTFSVTSSAGPEVTGTYDANEYSNNFTLGFGLEYVLRVSAGVSAKHITSHLAPIATEREQSAAEASLWAWDIGILAELPLVETFEGITSAQLSTSGGLAPVLDLGFGYVQRNIGDGVVYLDGGQSDPLPRQVAIGTGLSMGLLWRTSERKWLLVSFTVAREGEDLLVERYDDGTYSYTGGTGDIDFWDNVVLGKTPEGADLRRGWQLQCAELVSLRGGSIEPGAPWRSAYETSGYSFKLRGLLKIINLVDPGGGGASWLDFIANHIDIQYHHSQYEYEYGITSTFNSLNLVLRSLPI